MFGRLYVDVLYSDADSGQETWASVSVTGSEAGDWTVSQIAWTSGDDDAYLAGVEFG